MRSARIAAVLFPLVASTACNHFGSANAKAEPGLAASAAAAAAAATAPPAKHAPALTAEDRTLPDVVERVLPSVVSVSSVKSASADSRLPMDHPLLRRFFGPEDGRHGQPLPKQRGTGSGVVVAENIVLTNNHVVAGADEVTIKTSDGRVIEAKLVGADPKSDLAVLEVQPEPGSANLKPIGFGDSSELRLGETVLAIGNPFGVGQTVTKGIVSAKGRSGLGIVDYESFIQTDAAINPGNSGGALINTRGQLIGINTAILSRSGGNTGVGFAIPSNMAAPIMKSIMDTGRVVRGYLGVMIQDVEPELAKALKLNVDSGVLLSDVRSGTPAAKAGLRRGDVVVKLDGKAVKASAELRNRVAAAGADTTVTLDVLRDGKQQRVQVKLGELPESPQQAQRPSAEPEPSSTATGLALEPLTPELRRRLDVPDGATSGVVVSGVARGSAAARAGLRRGDVVLELNTKPVSSPEALERAWRSATAPFVLLVARDGNTVFVVVRD